MKLLVVGCSFSSGWAFKNEKDNPEIWPNQLGADVTNLSVTGTDNTGIFLNTLLANPADFDQVIVQWTGLDRVVLGSSMINADNPLPSNILPDVTYHEFYKAFLILNKRLNHLTRFCQMVSYLQQYPNIHFVNGLVDWDQATFDADLSWDRVSANRFLHDIIDVDQLPDQEIQRIWDLVKTQLANIDLEKWINPFNSLQKLRRDQVSATDLHPGTESHRYYAELILNKIRR